MARSVVAWHLVLIMGCSWMWVLLHLVHSAPNLVQDSEVVADLSRSPVQSARPPPQAQVPPSERIHLGPFQDKAQRTAVHGIFKAWPTLATETGAEGSIELGLGGGKGIKRRRSEWAGGDARYVKFTMYKENMESQVGGKGMREGMCMGILALGLCSVKVPTLTEVEEVPTLSTAPECGKGLT